MTIAATILTLLLAAQDAPPAPAPPPQPGEWRQLERVVMVVNQDIIPASQLARDMLREIRVRKLTTDTERQAAERRILADNVHRRLRVQAGANLGLDEKMLDRRVDDSLQRLRERENGVAGLAQFLASKDVPAQDVNRLLREDLYDQSWSDGVTGEGFGPLGRRTRDLYVRPGALAYLYRETLARSTELEAIGGSVGRVKFQQIVLDEAQAGGPDAARELARALKARVEAGEDMGELVRSHSAVREGDGISDVEEARLRELYPEIDAFTAAAQPGQVSDPIAGTRQNRPALRVVRLLERTAPRTPDFADPAVQEKLRRRAADRVREQRLSKAYGELLRAAYVWPPEIVRPPEDGG